MSVPELLADTRALADAVGAGDVTGAAWRLEAPDRDLDSNVIALRRGEEIAEHAGPDIDVLVHVIAGSGELETETGTIALHPGALLWLPRGSRRRFIAGPDGLRHLTVHRKRQALVLDPPSAGSP